MTHTSTLPDRMGGSERVMWEIARGLVARGDRALVVARRTVAGLPDRSVVDGVEIRRYADPHHSFSSLYLPSIVAARRAVRAAVADWRPDVVHAHHSLTALGGAGDRPRCYSFYGPWHEEFRHETSRRHDLSPIRHVTRNVWIPAKAAVVRRFERAAIRQSGAIVALSRLSVRQLGDIHGVPAGRVTVIPGGVDTARFMPRGDRRAARKSLGLPSDGPLLFTVRRLVPRMGVEGLLAALRELPGARLIIGGTGWLRTDLERAAARQAVSDRVTFAGFIPDDELPGYYQAADLVVMPSVALEGFGLIVLEALASGTPVVTTPGSGAVDVLATLEPRWVTADASPPALARAIAAALASAEAGVVARCRRHAEAYAWPGIVERYAALYGRLAGGR